ncbi:MAG: T9SS type A sorting domain-containing protein [Fibromonadales bacterium]|nr:T9SS type A sorting domain-containing protein [Fibromonadales bacterium]
MKKFFLLFLCILMRTIHAAPGLVINGTQFEYKGQKIFFSGMNLAWIDFNSDIGAAPLDENKWRKAVQDIRAAGGNAIRWWLFNNMSQSPNINTTTNLVSGLPVNTINNIKKALDIAEEYGVMVSLCLFSHNLMEKDQWGLYNGKVPYDANRKLFTDEGIEAFINNAMNPILAGVGNHNALWTWELFNEPEGMIQGWSGETMDLLSIQKFSNRVVAAIHDHDNTLLVSTGVNNAAALPTWTDAAMITAGGKQNGTLDFLQVHFYPEHLYTNENPFDHPFSYWNLNKPLVIGEFWAAGWDKETYPSYRVSTKTPVELYMHAYEKGYAGVLAWRYFEDNDGIAGKAVAHDYNAAKPGMEALAAKYEKFIKIKDYNSDPTSGNGVMQIATSNSAFATKNAIALQVQNTAQLEIYNLSGKMQKTLNFKNGVYNVPLNDLPKGMYIVKTTFGTNAQTLRMVVQ